MTLLTVGGQIITMMAILAFNAHWNEYFRPHIFPFSPQNYTLPLGIVALQDVNSSEGLSIVLTGVMMSLVPMIAIVVFAQRYLIEGILLTGIKG